MNFGKPFSYMNFLTNPSAVGNFQYFVFLVRPNKWVSHTELILISTKYVGDGVGEESGAFCLYFGQKMVDFFKASIFYLIFGYKSIITVIVFICIDCSKPRASFYLLAWGPPSGEFQRIQMGRKCQWNFPVLVTRILKMIYSGAVWPGVVWSIFDWTFSVIHAEINKNRALPLPHSWPQVCTLISLGLSFLIYY